MRKTIAAAIVGLLAIGVLSYWVWKTQYDEDRPMDFSRLNQHMKNFTPKFRPVDCIVRVNMVHAHVWTDDLHNRVFRNLMRFDTEVTPQMGAIWIRVDPHTDSLYAQFSDNCPDRFNVMRNWVESYARRYDSPRFTVSNEIVEPGPDTVDAKGFPWLD